MKTLFKTTAVAAALAFAPAAMAQDMGWYGDVGVAQVSVDVGGGDLDFTTIQGRVGYDFNDYFGAEGELGFGVAGESGGGASIDLSYNVGAYGVISTANTEGFEFFGRLGFAKAELDGNAGSISGSGSDDGLAYGAGIKYLFDGVNGIRADYTRYDFDLVEADVISVAYARKF